MKKRSMIGLMVLTIVMSGLFSYGGTYLANELNGKTSFENDVNATIQNVSTSSTSDTLTKLANIENEAYDLSITEIAELNGDSVVEITSEIVSTGGRLRQYVSEGAGSGVIIKNGYIVTNNHVIEGANKITVRLKNGEEYPAALIGKDAKTDIAVLKIEASNLKSAILGDSSKLTIGELAVAIGNPLGELGGTVTEGIISALDRDIEIDGQSMKLLQTSAAINPGNSGGGLFNSSGELIGIVNAKSSGSGIEGLGFAIPINSAKPIIDQIISYGYVQGRIQLGITMVDITNSGTAIMYRVSKTGVYVIDVTKQNGFQPGDRIVSINGAEITSAGEVKSMIDSLSVGQVVEFAVERNNHILTLNITLEEAKGL